MKIIQITDLHIGTTEEQPFGVDVRNNFLKILARVTTVPHDLLVISGDLCYEDGNPEIYRWIKTELDRERLTYLVLPGNHDSTEMMVECFDLEAELEEGEVFYTTDPDRPNCVFLNSGPGVISATALQLLATYLKNCTGPICLFLHHPPLPMGVPYMDEQHAMRECDPLLDLLTAHDHPITIFTGHYHVEKSVRWKNLDVHVTPSCFFQIDWQQADFAVDHHRIAYRYIDWDGNRLQHAVVYL